MPSIQMGINLPLELYTWVEDQAEARNIKKGAFVRTVLEEKKRSEEK